MKKDEVPQDASNSHYGGLRKLIYAQDDNGDVVGVKSAGWDAEADATTIALKLFAAQCDASWARATRGDTAPLEYYMYYRRMDLALLAQVTGLAKWRIRRHFKPPVFKRISERLLSRYAQALEIESAALRTLPARPLHESL